MPNLLAEILQKHKKSLEDAHVIYERIRNFRFFENFFAQNLRGMDFANLLSLCQGFEYEKVAARNFVFQKGDPSNNKFYVIISGKVAIVAPNAENKNQLINPTLKFPSELFNNRSSIENQNKTFLLPQCSSPKKLGTKLSYYSPQPRGTILSSPQKMSLKNQKTLWGPLSLLYSKHGNSNGQLSPKKNSIKPQSLTTLDAVEKQESPRKFEESFTEKVSNDNKPFAEYISDIGTLIRYMDVGEGFGELALKNNAPRSASVVCSTDCEFLIVTKKQFKLLFLEKEHEKEQFLRDTFPFLNSISTINFNYILFSFKTEVYNKGSYLTIEGKVNNPKKAKLFLIFRGECLIEKNSSIQVNHPSKKSQPFLQNTESLQLSLIGPGMIAGEEIVLNESGYDYSIKALSETVIVHSVSKAELETRFFKEFQKNIILMYEKKKRQRDLTFENLKKDYDLKAEQIKAKNIYSFQNMKMGAITNKSAIESLSRRINREQHISDSKETPQIELSPPFLQRNLEEETVEPPKKQMLLGFSHQEPAKTIIEATNKADFPARMPFGKRSIELISVEKDVESMKLFEDDDDWKLKKKFFKSSSTRVLKKNTSMSQNPKSFIENPDADEVLLLNLKKTLSKSKKKTSEFLSKTFNQGLKSSKNSELPSLNMENHAVPKIFENRQASRIPSETSENSLLQLKLSPPKISSQKSFSRRKDMRLQSQNILKIREGLAPQTTSNSTKASIYNFEDPQHKPSHFKDNWAIDNLSPIKISDVTSLKAKDYMLPKNKAFVFPNPLADNKNQQPIQLPDDNLINIKSPSVSSVALKSMLHGTKNDHNLRLHQSKNWRSRIFKNTHAHKFSLDNSVTKLSFLESSVQSLQVGN